jgi:threonine aldolase
MLKRRYFSIMFCPNGSKPVRSGKKVMTNSNHPDRPFEVDLRSDTVTRPTAPMLEAMMSARVGDMVFGDDPSVNALEAYAARLFGMDGAIFCPSGTMTNQIAIRVHTSPGDEVICSKLAHIYLFEGGGMASNSGAQASLIDTVDGTFTVDQAAACVNPDDVHRARTRLVSVENTVNRGAGTCWDFSELKRIGEFCRSNGLSYHLDGARLFNALAVTGESPADYGKVFDSISICLSKGLGAPVGSLLLGSTTFIKEAKRVRKVFGGYMRQAGYIAAAGLYALQNNTRRLTDDHVHAKMIGEALEKCSWVSAVSPVSTNIIIFTTAGEITALQATERMKARGILVHPVGRREIRMVTHLDVTSEMTEYACENLAGIF